MAIPKFIPIVREENYHTHNIGVYEGGRQFMGFVTASLLNHTSEDWQKNKRWYAVLHTFEKNGDYIETKYFFTGTTADGEREVVDKAQSKLDEFLDFLKNKKFRNIKVALFETEIDGSTFGLVPEVLEEEDYEAVHLQPNDLVFFDPWDGYYDT